MTGAPIVLAVAAAAFAAASLRLDGIVATLVAAYVALVAQVAAAIWLLSPFDAVTVGWLTLVEAALALAAGWIWVRRGRPLPSAAGALADLRLVRTDPLTLAFVGVVTAGLAYELVLALTVPPNNWDSLTYHLTRAAAWHQSHGVHWVPNAPTARINEFQPLAEQLILFLFVAGSTVLYALPQYVAQLAILAAVYGAARRLGYEPRAAARGTALVAMLSLVALESTTAQNDLVAASFPVAAVFLLLGTGTTEAFLAGLALALGIGVKLTTALALPVVAILVARGGRRRLRPVAGGAAVGLVAAAAWGYVLNVAHTGHLLGHGQGRLENSAATTAGGTVSRSLHLLYRLLDLSVTPDWLVVALAVAGIAAGAEVLRRTRSATAPLATWPLLVPAVTVGVVALFDLDPAYVARSASEDTSGFGPVGTAALVGAPLAVLSVRAVRRDPRVLALALATPAYVVLLAALAKYNVWICRFLVVPAILTAPLFAALCRRRAQSAALLVLGTITLFFATTDDAAKKIRSPAGRPWTLSQAGAMNAFPAQPTGAIVAAALTAYDRAVPADACVGAVLDPDEPAYLLWGPALRRRVVFLPSLDAVGSAYRNGLRYVVVSTGANAPVAKPFSDAGWRIRPLGSYWLLALAPSAGRGSVLTTC